MSTSHDLLGSWNDLKRGVEENWTRRAAREVAGGAWLRQLLVETGGVSGIWQDRQSQGGLVWLVRRSEVGEEGGRNGVAGGGKKEKKCRKSEKERKREKNDSHEFRVLNLEYIKFRKFLKKFQFLNSKSYF